MYIAKDSTPCQENDERLWFSKPGSKRTQRAKELCLTCDERVACLDSTLKFEAREGTQPCVLGGLTEAERGRLLNLSTTTSERDTA